MTRSHIKALQFIGARIAESGVPPTLDEIAEHLGVRSKSRAHQIVSALKGSSLVVSSPSRARSIALTARGREVIRGLGAFQVVLPHDVRELLVQYADDQGKAPETIILEAVRVYVGAAA